MENAINTQILSPKGTFPADVAKVIDNYKLVINRGEANGIREGQRMLVYRVSDEEIIDPRTGESLGYLELVRGTGKIIFVQEKISILESDKKADSRSFREILSIDIQQYQAKLEQEMYSKTLKTQDNALSLPKVKQLIDNNLLIPFDNPQVGDQVKPI